MPIYDSNKNIQFENDIIANYIMNQEWYTLLPTFRKTVPIYIEESSQYLGQPVDGSYSLLQHSIAISPRVLQKKSSDTYLAAVILHELCHAYEVEIVQLLNSQKRFNTHDYRIGLFCQLYDILHPSRINPYYYMGYTKDKCNAFFHTDLTHPKSSSNIVSYFPALPDYEHKNPNPFFKMNTLDRYYAQPNETLAATLQQIPYVWSRPEKEQALYEWLHIFSYYVEHIKLPDGYTLPFNGLSFSDIQNINTMYYQLDALEKKFNTIDAAYSTVLFQTTQNTSSPLLAHKYDITPVHLRAKAFLHLHEQFKQGLMSEKEFHKTITTPFSPSDLAS